MLAMLQLMERYHYLTPAKDLPRVALAAPEAASSSDPVASSGFSSRASGQLSFPVPRAPDRAAMLAGVRAAGSH